MTGQKVYRVGIVGAGFGEKVHLPSFTAHPKFEVVAIASPSSAKRIAQERKIAGFDSARAMIDGIDLDVVSIASPPFSHHNDVLAALNARKHVICEKPFALNIKQA
ncbi:MAG: Gfo/Idh/MocA family oxidoreductase, partial [Candidatus Eremiobacteraeota bacterium]|nr:Gfo/Idh/MocA family oxidoreductase [Candidatus Eremiobacteraeota bacterium]